ncbi:MAG TPA: ABC transporter ATP-binding protein [Oligoflexia bacterium]|nr:ABC transporter ATP-binding protein [Oligoflexia bacterium]
MIEATGLCKNFGEIEAVSNLSFSVAAGEVVGLLGPNGAGKTTTMRLLTTFLPPTGGTAKVAGWDICRESESVRKNIGYLPESPPLYPEMQVGEYLKFIAQLKGIPKKELRAKVEAVLERCALDGVVKRLCAQLSKGYRQRIALAGALVHEPKVLILDEPTSGLDPAQIIEVRQMIRKLGEEHTVVLSTHIMQEVSETCSRVIIISGGRIVVQGNLAELTREKCLEEKFLEAVAGTWPSCPPENGAAR